MNRVICLLMLYLLTMSLSAQRIAVFDFKAGPGVTQKDIDGISKIFVSYFNPNGYTKVEKNQINNVINKQGLKKNNLTQVQIFHICKILRATKVVVGEVTIVDGQFNVAVKAFNVGRSIQYATDNVVFDKSSLLVNVKSLAENFSKTISNDQMSEGTYYGVAVQQGDCFVDLGLLSGTIWASNNLKLSCGSTVASSGNISSDFIDSKSAVPTAAQWKELLTLCKWEWTGLGFNVVGLNGNSIYIPACGDENGDYIGERLCYVVRENCIIIIKKDLTFSFVSGEKGFVRMIK